jgi:hypothetical protein
VTVTGLKTDLLNKELGTATAALGEILDEQANWFTDLEIDTGLGRIEQVQGRLDAVRLRLVRQAETRGLHAANGHRTVASWQSARHRTKSAADRTVALTARRMVQMELVEAALVAGQILGAHAARLARACRPKVVDLFRRDEEMLVGFAKELSWKDFEIAVSQWELFADPDKAEGTEDKAWAERTLQLNRVGDGYVLHATTDLVTGEFWEKTLQRLERELFSKDWNEAEEIHGDSVSNDVLGRSNMQRRHDALNELLRLAMGTPADRTPDPEVVVMIDAVTLREELERLADPTGAQPARNDPGGWFGERLSTTLGGSPVSPAKALKLALRGHIRRVVFESKSIVIDAGQRQRFFTGAMRQVLEVRDRGCTQPGCDTKPWLCDADHVTPFDRGGPTALSNGKLLCRSDHRHKTATKDRMPAA